jgi:Flp pilus assembly protein TadD
MAQAAAIASFLLKAEEAFVARDLATAIDALASAADAAPDDPRPHQALAWTLWHCGDKEQAKARVNELFQEKPHDLVTTALMIFMVEAEGERERATALSIEYLRRQPFDLALAAFLAELLTKPERLFSALL